jgi:hypothetical protein
MNQTKQTHASGSFEQRSAEFEILEALQNMLGVRFEAGPEIDQPVELDGFADSDVPICVEAWAHQGPAKGGQIGKVMRDMCKLVLVERLLGKRCRKIFAVSDEATVAFLRNSWQGRFADEFGVERIVVDISETTRQSLREAQRRQYR